ncbi:Maturase K, partial [Frankliniella fusca]
ENKTTRMSIEQRDIMLKFMKSHPALATNKFTAPDGVKHKARLLTELTAMLNSCPSGASKASDKWMKSWQDWRSDVKSKASKIRRHCNGTGGGPPLKLTLSPLEDELLAFLGEVAVSGHNVIDPLDAPPESSIILDVDNIPIVELASLNAGEVENVLTGPSSPAPSSATSEDSSSNAQGSTTSERPAKRRRRTLTSSTESLGQNEQKLVDIATEQLSLQKRQIEIAEQQLKLQREQGDRYGAALEKVADSLGLAATAMATYFMRSSQ